MAWRLPFKPAACIACGFERVQVSFNGWLRRISAMTRHSMPVLLVDDHDDVRDGLQMILESEGWAVETALDPRDALNRLFGGLRPCIILLDLMSPIMNGVEFHRELLKHPQLQKIPMVAYSGLNDVREKARQLAADATSDLPAEIDRLLAAVRQHCTV
jgi:CheY-like chemotaxis protein